MKYLFFIIAFLVTGCGTTPTVLQDGKVAKPPIGCIEGRTRGVPC